MRVVTPKGELRWHVASAGYSVQEVTRTLMDTLEQVPPTQRLSAVDLVERAGIAFDEGTPVEQVLLIEAAELAFAATGYRPVSRRGK